MKRTIESGKESHGAWGSHVAWAGVRVLGWRGGGARGKEERPRKRSTFTFASVSSKEIWALTGVLFLPGMEQKTWEREEIKTIGAWARKCMLGSKHKRTSQRAPKSSGPDLQKSVLPLVPRARVKMSPSPTHCSSPVHGTNSQWCGFYILVLEAFIPPKKEIRHWWLPLFTSVACFPSVKVQ